MQTATWSTGGPLTHQPFVEGACCLLQHSPAMNLYYSKYCRKSASAGSKTKRHTSHLLKLPAAYESSVLCSSSACTSRVLLENDISDGCGSPCDIVDAGCRTWVCPTCVGRRNSWWQPEPRRDGRLYQGWRTGERDDCLLLCGTGPRGLCLRQSMASNRRQLRPVSLAKPSVRTPVSTKAADGGTVSFYRSASVSLAIYPLFTCFTFIAQIYQPAWYGEAAGMVLAGTT